MSISAELVHCACVELLMALEDRLRPGWYREPNNHSSSHCLGGVLLLVAGLEAWLNESVPVLFMADKSDRVVALHPVLRKYYEIAKRANGAEVPLNQELEMLVDVRNEIAHYLPYRTTEQDKVPRRFAELQRRGLFITTRDPDWHFTQKLSSYRLAYWAFSTVEAAVKALLMALGPTMNRVSFTAENFYDYRSIRPPEELADYDKDCQTNTAC
jgi:hypothetical protein